MAKDPLVSRQQLLANVGNRYRKPYKDNKITGVKLTNAGRDAMEDIRNQVLRREDALASGLLAQSKDGNLHAGGSDYQNYLYGVADHIAAVYGRESHTDPVFDLSGYDGQAPGANFIIGKSNRLANLLDRATKYDTQYRGAIAANRSNQRQTQAVNQAVQSGRRKPRGSSVSLPKAALAGLGQSGSKLI